MKRMCIILIITVIAFYSCFSQCTVSFTKIPVFGSSSAFHFQSTVTAPIYITQYHWDFGNGDISTEINPTYNYSSHDTDLVCLTVSGFDTTNSTPFTCSFCDSVIHQNKNSGIWFMTFPQTGLSYNFPQTTLSFQNILDPHWDFGDGTTSTSSGSHTFSSPGLYTVCFQGVGIPPPTPCTYCEKIMVGPDTGCNIQFSSQKIGTSTFQFNSIGAPSGPLTSYYWDFADFIYDSTNYQANPNHQFPSGNSTWYRVCLALTGIDSSNIPFYCKYCDTVTTSDECWVIADFNVLKNNNVISCTNISSCTNGNLLSYKWYFGDGDSSLLTNPTHTYALPGTYTVSLVAIAIDSFNNPCYGGQQKTVELFPSSITSRNIDNITLSVYPNPTLVTSDIISSVPMQELKIFSTIGEVIYQRNLNELLTYSLNTSFLKRGVYFLSMESRQGVRTIRLIKE